MKHKNMKHRNVIGMYLINVYQHMQAVACIVCLSLLFYHISFSNHFQKSKTYNLRFSEKHPHAFGTTPFKASISTTAVYFIDNQQPQAVSHEWGSTLLFICLSFSTLFISLLAFSLKIIPLN